MATNKTDATSTAWVIGIVVVIAMIAALVGNNSSSTSSPSHSPTTPSTRYESTEDKLRRVYDSQGIQYDDQMIREDAKAVEQLHREFGQ